MKAFLQVLHKVIEETGRKRLCGFLKRRDESVWKVVERCAKVWVAKIKAGRIYFFLSFMFLQEFLQEIGVTGGEMSFFLFFIFLLLSITPSGLL